MQNGEGALEEGEEQGDGGEGLLPTREQIDVLRAFSWWPGHDLDAGLEDVVLVEEAHLRLAATKEPGECLPEGAIDRVEGFPEPLARGLVDLADGVLQVLHRGGHVLPLGLEEREAFLLLVVFVGSQHVDRADPLDDELGTGEVALELRQGRLVEGRNLGLVLRDRLELGLSAGFVVGILRRCLGFLRTARLCLGPAVGGFRIGEETFGRSLDGGRSVLGVVSVDRFRRFLARGSFFCGLSGRDPSPFGDVERDLRQLRALEAAGQGELELFQVGEGEVLGVLLLTRAVDPQGFDPCAQLVAVGSGLLDFFLEAAHLLAGTVENPLLRDHSILGPRPARESGLELALGGFHGVL